MAKHRESLQNPQPLHPTADEARAAVATLIRWAGDDPQREGLRDTPERVIRAYDEFFSGYCDDPQKILSRTFEDVGGYQDFVFLRGIRVESHCEHHMVPIIGTAHLAYWPDRRVVGISKLARVVESFARRLQTQETMTAQIADAIDHALQPHGVAVVIDAAHQCMTTRGIRNPGVATVTMEMRGIFKDDAPTQERWLRLPPPPQPA